MIHVIVCVKAWKKHPPIATEIAIIPYAISSKTHAKGQ